MKITKIVLKYTEATDPNEQYVKISFIHSRFGGEDAVWFSSDFTGASNFGTVENAEDWKKSRSDKKTEIVSITYETTQTLISEERL